MVVKRERIHDMAKSTFLGRFKVIDMGVRIVVKNNKKTAISLTLKDQIPISSDEEIEITAVKISKAHHNTKTGELTWNENLASGETKVYEIRYSVKYPKNKKLANF